MSPDSPGLLLEGADGASDLIRLVYYDAEGWSEVEALEDRQRRLTEAKEAVAEALAAAQEAQAQEGAQAR